MDLDLDIKDVWDPPHGPPVIGWEGSDLKSVLGEGYGARLEEFADRQGFLAQLEWSKGRRCPQAIFAGQVLTARLNVPEAESQKLQREDCVAMGQQVAQAMRGLIQESAGRVRVFPLPPRYDQWNRVWNLDLVVAESDEEGGIEDKDVYEFPVPKAFELPAGADQEAAHAWAAVIEGLGGSEDLDSGGTPHVFYTPEQWAVNHPGQAEGSVLVVVHQGGSHAPYFNNDYGAHALVARMMLALRKAGFYSELASGGASFIYQSHGEGDDLVRSLEDFIRQREAQPLAPDQQALISQARQQAQEEALDDDDAIPKELDWPEETEARVRQLFARAGLRLSHVIESPLDPKWGELGKPQRIIFTYLLPDSSKPWTVNQIATPELADFCRQIKSYLYEILDNEDIDFSTWWSYEVGAWQISWGIGDPSITQHREIREDDEDLGDTSFLIESVQQGDEDDTPPKDMDRKMDNACDDPAMLHQRYVEFIDAWKANGWQVISSAHDQQSVVVEGYMTAGLSTDEAQRQIAALANEIFLCDSRDIRSLAYVSSVGYVDVYIGVSGARTVFDESQEAPVRPCVHCGYCCKKAPCPYGEWDPVAKQCKELTPDNLCGIHGEIPPGTAAPAFGTGCCSPLNTDRQNIVRQRRLARPPAQEALADDDVDPKELTPVTRIYRADILQAMEDSGVLSPWGRTYERGYVVRGTWVYSASQEQVQEKVAQILGDSGLDRGVALDKTSFEYEPVNGDLRIILAHDVILDSCQPGLLNRLMEAGASVRSVQDQEQEGIVEVRGECHPGQTLVQLAEAFAVSQESLRYDPKTGRFVILAEQQMLIAEVSDDPDMDVAYPNEPGWNEVKARAVDLSTGIWGDDHKLRRAFSWLTRVGLAPKFGSTSIANYQHEQCAAIDAIVAAGLLFGIAVSWVRLRKGAVLAWDGNRWVSIGSIYMGAFAPDSPGPLHEARGNKARKIIQAAAVRYKKDGSVHLGATHSEAMDALLRTGVFGKVQSLDELDELGETNLRAFNHIWNQVEIGFTTVEGKFVGLDEASRLAGRPDLHGEDIRENSIVISC